jgi:diguanylate cyclase (GGDEF)-like protein
MHLTKSDWRLAAPVGRWSATAAALLAGCLLCVFALDRSTGVTPVQHLYYLPIMLAGITFGMTGGVTAASIAVMLYHIANPYLLTFRYEEPDLVQIALFLAVGIISARLSADRDRLRRLALTDDLTGLHNLRSFEAQLEKLVRVSRRDQTPLAVIVLDVDRLKSLNDQYGHLTGAEAVREVGHIIARERPPEAVACRYGGDEFVIAIPRCTSFKMRKVADTLRRAVNDCAPVLARHHFPAGTLSISSGVACASFDSRLGFPTPARSDVECGEQLFREADAALYRAKTAGRNQVCVA